MPYGTKEAMTSTWNAEQAAYIAAPLADGCMAGLPGGGKSRSILSRIMHQVQQKIIPERSALILTFSKDACEDMRRKVATICPKAVDKTKHVRTIHSLSLSIVNRLVHSKSTSSLDTVVYRATQLLKGSTEEEVRNVYALQHIRTIRLDEAQDISKIQYEFARSLATVLKATLELIGDSNQNIYQFQGGTDIYLRNHPGFRVQLRENYRSTAKLVELASEARPWKSDAPMISARGVQGETPTLISGDVNTILKRTLDIIRMHRKKNRHIAIIGPVRHAKPKQNGHVARLGLSLVANMLFEKGIPFMIHYSESDDSDESKSPAISSTEGANTDYSVVHLYTCHGSKGLEFDVVLFLNYHQTLMGRPFDKLKTSELIAYRYLVYVALTRAKDYLYLFHLHDQPIWQGYFDYAHLLTLEQQDTDKKAELKPVTNEKQQLDEPEKFVTGAWKKLIKNRTFITEQHLATIEDIICPTITPAAESTAAESTAAESAAAVDDYPALPEYDQLSTLYGEWAENMFYYAFDGSTPILGHIKKMLNNMTVVPASAQMAVAFTEFCGVMMYESPDFIQWSSIDRCRMSLMMNEKIRPLLEYLDNQRIMGATDVCITLANRCCFFDTDILSKMIQGLPPTLAPSDIWKMCLFLWQYRCEAKYRWFADYSQHLEALNPYALRIQVLARSISQQGGNYDFQVSTRMSLLPIVGRADMVSWDKQHVIEMKFSKSGAPSTSDAIQVAGYLEMLDGKHSSDWKVQIFNLFTCDVYDVCYDVTPQSRWKLYKCLSECLSMPFKEAVWVYQIDKETGVNLEEVATGLLIDNASHIKDIIDLCEYPMMISHNDTHIHHDYSLQYSAVLVSSATLLKGGADKEAIASLYSAVSNNKRNCPIETSMVCDILNKLGMDYEKIRTLTMNNT